ncbi:LPXTG cell wall anchor domain-containing protein [Sutcliffiella horikoshii]|uniref:LPXTG cell wall anchor domain-containing protein n=1 Tax=Sutcliffiella horikoshii TaxID=79883 RepID=UPI003CEFCDB6
MKKIKVLLKLPILVLFISFISGYSVIAEEREEIDLMTSPTKILFDISKMVPGDWATRELVITNNGQQDFNYLFSAKLISGSSKMYEALSIVITDASGELYKGKLSDFNKLKPRFLSSSDQETLTFIVEMPYELGNEYQGLECEFEFKFYVEGTLGGALPVDNRLPVTATEMFNYILIGAIMATFGGMLFFYQKRKNRDVKRKSFKEKVIGP